MRKNHVSSLALCATALLVFLHVPLQAQFNALVIDGSISSGEYGETANGATYGTGSVPAAGCTTTDALPGVAKPASKITGGGSDGSAAGSTTFGMDR